MIKKPRAACAALLLGVLSLGATAARADVMYTYTGYNFTTAASPFTKSDSVSGWFIMSQPLARNLNYKSVESGSFAPIAISWSFTDGLTTITSDTSNLLEDQIAISTNNAGNITLWAISIDDSVYDAVYTNDDGQAGAGNTYDGGHYDIGSDTLVQAGNTSKAGVWTETLIPETPVPEPPSVATLITALVGLIFLHSRRRTLL